jgi:hypothetical protein
VKSLPKNGDIAQAETAGEIFCARRRRFRAGVCPELHCIDLIGVSSIGSAPHIISREALAQSGMNPDRKDRLMDWRFLNEAGQK